MKRVYHPDKRKQQCIDEDYYWSMTDEERDAYARAYVPSRRVSRRTLLRALSDEYRHGNSLSKLYVGLLCRTVLDQEPRLSLKPKDPRFAKSPPIVDLEACGVQQHEIEKARLRVVPPKQASALVKSQR